MELTKKLQEMFFCIIKYYKFKCKLYNYIMFILLLHNLLEVDQIRIVIKYIVCNMNLKMLMYAEKLVQSYNSLTA